MTLVKLGEVCRTQSGGTPSRKQPSFWASDTDGIPWVKSQELTDGPVCSVSETITPLGLSESSAKLVPSGTVLLAMYGGIPTVGRVGYLTTDAATNQAICALFPKPDRIDNVFLFYALVEARQRLWAKAHGAAQQNVSQTLVRELEIHVPPLEHQYRIGSVLRTLDDLIENNRRRIEVSEEMAQAIYREWFVHFRFPGHENATFVDSSLGPIPYGWTVEPIEEIASIKYGKMLPTKDILGGPIPVYGASKLIGYHTEANVMEPTILMGCRGTCGQVSISDAPAFITNNSFTIVPHLPADKSWLFHLLDTRGVEEFIGGAAQPQITLKSIGALEVLAPPSHLREEFGSVAGPLLGCGQSLRTKITSLSQIMDALLPKLVSGEIDVSDLDLDAVMEGVV